MPTSGGARFGRGAGTLISILGVCILALLALGLNAYISGWPGIRSERLLRSGETLTTTSGLSLVIPEGWEGRYVKYYRFPAWLPIGDSADLARGDMAELRRHDEAPGLTVTILSLRRDGRAARRLISETAGAALPTGETFSALVSSSVDSSASASVRVLASVSPKHDIALMMITGAGVVNPGQAAGLVWEALSIEGVDAPWSD